MFSKSVREKKYLLEPIKLFPLIYAVVLFVNSKYKNIKLILCIDLKYKAVCKVHCYMKITSVSFPDASLS